MNINYGEQLRFFQRFSKGVREELQNSRKSIIDSVNHTEKFIEKIESTSSRFLGIMQSDKTMVIDQVANIVSNIEKYEEKLPSYYYDMQTTFRYVNQYRVELSTLRNTLLELQDRSKRKQEVTRTSSATDEFSRLALSEEIDVTSKNITNYSSFIDTMSAFLDEEEIKDMVDVKIRLLAWKDKIGKYLVNLPDKSDEFHRVFYFFHKENISETHHKYSKPSFHLHTFFHLLTVTGVLYFMYYQENTCL